jgi:hypothetical protein
MKRKGGVDVRNVWLFLGICCLFLLTGCVTEYTREDIQAYVQESLQLENAQVSRTYEEVKGEDGYTDRLWTVSLPEKDLTFYVLDDYGWGMESVSNYLRDDYRDRALASLSEDFPKFQMLQIETDKWDVLWYSAVTGMYCNQKELRLCCDELHQFQSWLQMKGYGDLSAAYRLLFDNPLRDVTEYVVDDGDIFGNTDSIQSYEEMAEKYYSTVLDYRFDSSDITEEEISAFMKTYPYPVGVYEGSEIDPKLYKPSDIRYYEDIIANQFGYGISFGSLYLILEREGFSPQGTVERYSFIGSDGSTYEISYSFLDEMYSRNQGPTLGYYYLKDGEKQKMNAFFYNHFSTREIEKMTGLRLVDKVQQEPAEE